MSGEEKKEGIFNAQNKPNYSYAERNNGIKECVAMCKRFFDCLCMYECANAWVYKLKTILCHSYAVYVPQAVIERAHAHTFFYAINRTISIYSINIHAFTCVCVRVYE